MEYAHHGTVVKHMLLEGRCGPLMANRAPGSGYLDQHGGAPASLLE